MDGDGFLSYVSISGLASLLGSAGLYVLGDSMRGQVRALEQVKHVEKLSDVKSLAALVPLMVAVTGRVGSLNPRQCELSDKQAVLYEVRSLSGYGPSSGLHLRHSSGCHSLGNATGWQASVSGRALPPAHPLPPSFAQPQHAPCRQPPAQLAGALPRSRHAPPPPAAPPLEQVLEQDVFQRSNNAGGVTKEYYTTRSERGDTDWYLVVRAPACCWEQAAAALQGAGSATLQLSRRKGSARRHGLAARGGRSQGLPSAAASAGAGPHWRLLRAWAGGERRGPALAHGAAPAEQHSSPLSPAVPPWCCTARKTGAAPSFPLCRTTRRARCCASTTRVTCTWRAAHTRSRRGGAPAAGLCPALPRRAAARASTCSLQLLCGWHPGQLGG
jgi:hypothetical protein